MKLRAYSFFLIGFLIFFSISCGDEEEESENEKEVEKAGCFFECSPGPFDEDGEGYTSCIEYGILDVVDSESCLEHARDFCSVINGGPDRYEMVSECPCEKDCAPNWY